MSEIRFYPSYVVWEITFACNMRCIHCGTSAGKIRPDELTTAEALALIDELGGLDCEHLALSGGEPLLRDDWRELARRSKQNRIRTYMITNAFAVTPMIADDMVEVGLDKVGVSFDGVEKTHNYIRQRDDSYARVMKAFDLFRERNMYFDAVSQVSNINIGELDEMREILIDRGVRNWRIQMTTTTGRMRCLSDLVLSLPNYSRLVDKLIEFRGRDGIRIDPGENIGYYGCKGTELLNGGIYLGCYAGVRVAGIESNGAVKGCLSMPEEFVEGNIRDSSFTAIWNNPAGFAYNRQFTRRSAGGPCRDCRYLPLCRGGCTTTSFSQTGERANNPYCTYRLEMEEGIKPPEDEPYIAEVLARFDDKQNPEPLEGQVTPDCPS
ncbi:MAG: radical SAM protein [Candidatus Zixiibacteriota bacterium]